jgi:RES domain-containing protein
LLPPGTLVSYRISLSSVVDLSAGYDPEHWDRLWKDWNCDFRAMAIGGIEPPTWVLADEVLTTGAKGLLFPSTWNPGGVNLVVYTDRLASNDVLEVFDPREDLPRNQDSWPHR